MAVQENTKTVTDHLNDVSMRIAQARGVVMSLMGFVAQIWYAGCLVWGL